jgi:hypothetical protein
MFQLGFAYAIQADREREIADLVRQRRLLEPDVDGEDPRELEDEHAKPRPQRIRTQAARG